MPTRLRVLSWNIAEGNLTSKYNDPPNAKLNDLSYQINLKLPDIVLLNEVLNWDRLGGFIGQNVNQTEWLAHHCGMPYYFDLEVNTLGLSAHKAVSILSKYPLQNRIAHPVPKINGQAEYDFGTIEATVTVEGVDIHLFSTRFCPITTSVDGAKNIKGHEDITRIIQSLNLNVPIIFGGDFNTDRNSGYFVDFITNSGLTTAISAGVDNIFYKGEFEVSESEVNTSVFDVVSDHDYLFTEFIFNPLTTTRRLSFNPAIHGWHFSNKITSDIAGPIRTYGLCGGMALSAFNYFRHNIPIPSLHEETLPEFAFADIPSSGRMINVPVFNPGFPHPVFDFIYHSQMATFESGNIQKQLVLPANDTNQEHYRSSVQVEFPLIKNAIDNGRYVILGLRSPTPGDLLSGHQTLVYGYDDHNHTLFMYDSNHPDKEVIVTGNGTSLAFSSTGENCTQYKSYYLQMVLDPAFQSTFTTYDILRNQRDNFSVRPTYNDQVGATTLNFTGPGTYSIQSNKTGRFLDIQSISLADGAHLQQWDFTNGANQKFRIQRARRGRGTQFKIIATHSGKCLDVPNASTANSVQLIQWKYSGDDNQLFNIIHVKDNYYKIVSVHSQKVLDVYNNDSSNGAKIIQYDFSGDANQIWIFHKI